MTLRRCSRAKCRNGLLCRTETVCAVTLVPEGLSCTTRTVGDGANVLLPVTANTSHMPISRHCGRSTSFPTLSIVAPHGTLSASLTAAGAAVGNSNHNNVTAMNINRFGIIILIYLRANIQPFSYIVHKKSFADLQQGITNLVVGNLHIDDSGTRLLKQHAPQHPSGAFFVLMHQGQHPLNVFQRIFMWCNTLP